MNKILEMRGVRKSFGSVRALRGVDFSLDRGEITALLGDNGAGKSTLIKIISGLYAPDEGDVEINGVRVTRFSVARARALGVEAVYQDRALGVSQPLWRNLFAGRHVKTRFGLIDAKREREAAAEIISRLGLSGAGISPDTPAGLLSGGERQGLAIGRAMYFKAGVVILDEPTTALAVSESEKVLDFMRMLKSEGRSVVVITHTIEHAYRVADRFVILSHGKVFGEWRKDELTEHDLFARLMEAER
ncbi:ATP-binding cassette domain-containing protein [Cloacibacillus sp. An23]|uniref:ATP-binding cassette domain-containing protein n=1 Tax=Cloacibacillus sp. An23 TaxID=1965591 RepID=UPI000B38C256|nr:ATP-binding cassette domain-containing protein [Cloacibacillus sp. An23]OUO93677.1 ABC transporter ATP-binding protein [Cloacibacillus sp. An23]